MKTPETKDQKLRRARLYLRELLAASSRHLHALDAEMKLPASVDRGKRIAAISNDLDLQRQISQRYGL